MVPRLRTAVATVVVFVVASPVAAQSYQGPSRQVSSVENMTPDEIAWHVRAGLNVAAPACRDGDAAAMVARYNVMLGNQRAPLAAARAGVEARLRMRFGAAWRERDDDDMTRLYNHFAAPEAHDAFCATARNLLLDGATVTPAGFYAFARDALPQLEQAFTPQPGPVARARYMPAASGGAPRIAYATNAHVPLAPDGREVADAQRVDKTPPGDPTDDPAPGFSDTAP